MDQGPLGDLTALVLEEVHYSAMKYSAGAPLLLGMNLLMAALDVPEYTEKKEVLLQLTVETKPADKSHTHTETCSSSTSTVPVLTLRNARDSLWTISRQRTGDYTTSERGKERTETVFKTPEQTEK